MKIFLAGYYGFKNFGDELLLYKVIQDISEIIPDVQFLVWSGDIGYTERFLKDYYVKAVNRFSLEETLSAVKSSDIVVLGGGGLIQEHYGLRVEHLFKEFGRHVPSYAIPPLLGRIFGKKVFYWCLGHGPVVTEEGEEFSRWFYSLADVVTLRDEYSFIEVKRLLPELEVYLDTDPLFDFDFKRYSQEEITGAIGFNIRSWFNEDALINEFSKALKELSETEGFKVIPIPCDLSTDNEVIKRVLDSLRKELIFDIKIESVTDVIKAISASTVFVGMRLHALIAGYMLGKPILGISYDPKTEEFLRKVGKEYLRVTEVSDKDLVLKTRKIVRLEEYEPEGFEYKTPEIFRDFVKREKKRFLRVDFQYEDDKDRDDRYMRDFVKNLFFQREELYKKIAEVEGETRRLKEENAKLREENSRAIKERDSYLASLNEIYNSNVWRLAQKYYDLRDNTFLRHLYPIYKPIVNKIFGKKKHGVKLERNQKENRRALIKNFLLNSERIIIMLSSTPFRQIYNQRPLNLAKKFAKRDYSVIFVSWQWSPEEIIPSSYEEVYKGIFQIPFYDFMDFYGDDIFEFREKIFYITFPLYDLFPVIRTLRAKGFKIVYDIMDDWEGFKEVGQAPWYEKKAEERILLESDFVFAVKKYLKDKFNHLRSDIIVIGNGYDESLLGEDARFIAGTAIDDKSFTVGYYGWLSEARFDWEFVLGLAENFKDLRIQLIGYALSEKMKSRLEEFKNIEYIGEVEPSALKNYVSKWNIGMIPFKEQAISKGADPLKVYEYTYFGLPTITKGLYELNSNPLLMDFSISAKFKEILEKFNSREKINDFRQKHIEKIKEFLERTSWEARNEQILNIMRGDTFWT